MKGTSLKIFLAAFFFSLCASLAQTDAGEAAATLRGMYFQRDFEGAVAQGKELMAKSPEAPELRAWYILSLARDGRSKEAVAAADEMLASAKESPWSHFNVLLDDGYVNKAEIRSFPTTWFIDPEGQIRFVKVGWTEKLVEEFTWRIEALGKSEDR